ncbi:MAG: hypothetical protein JXM72_09035 [Deltaproteobacteria bacterium]|nr:hypothetical protein [Deltaproteobacteria bacterium]
MGIEVTGKTRGSILEQILKTPAYKDILRVNLNEMRKETGSSLVKTLLSEDPEVLLSLISAATVFINTLVGASGELAVRVRNMYPPEMLKAYLISMAEDIDREAVKECSAAWSELVSDLWKASSDVRLQARKNILTSGPMVIAGAINTAARSINSLVRDDPNALNTFVSKVFRDVDNKEISLATMSLAEAFLDQKWHLASWAWALVRKRMRRKFGI